MFNKILIANRGEIAVRIIRTCKEMGIKTVAVYSEIDEESIHVHLADESVCIGPAQSGKSYLNISNIVSAALITKCDAIHPGYGFLSENSQLVEACINNNIKFIGPTTAHIGKMGNKSEARRTMMEAGVPVIPGSEDSTNDGFVAYEIANSIGFPVMIKASSGGGGRGMRVVHYKEEFLEKFKIAKSEASIAFDDDSMYIEKLIENPRHIEIQILGDSFGNIIHLGERDCSLQRRNQKVLEETPCTVISEELRQEMCLAAIKAAKAVDYESVGTIEFLLDKYKRFYFIEMNTRIQVEHTITEMVTRVDLIKEQIKVAYGQPLDLKQEDIIILGHSIECRINAEDEDFRPCPGRIDGYFVPGGFGIRVDSHIYDGYTIPHTYDSMIGKLIVWGNNREEAINRMKRAINEIVITGIKTNINFQNIILNNNDFVNNNIDTSFIEREILNKEL